MDTEITPEMMAEMYRRYRTHPVKSSYQFPDEIRLFYRGERNIYHIRLENGSKYIFKPYRPEDKAQDLLEYIPEDELLVYDKFSHLQGKYLPICYGLVKMEDKMSGLLLEDCGSKTYEDPPEDETSKFLLFMRAMCALERLLAAGLLHQDMEFRNMVYDPKTLQMRIIDIGPVPGFDETPKDLWRYFYADFAWEFKYTKLVTGFWWGVFNVARVILAHPFDLSLYPLVLHFCLALVKRRMTMGSVRKADKSELS